MICSGGLVLFIYMKCVSFWMGWPVCLRHLQHTCQNWNSFNQIHPPVQLCNMESAGSVGVFCLPFSMLWGNTLKKLTRNSHGCSRGGFPIQGFIFLWIDDLLRITFFDFFGYLKSVIVASVQDLKWFKVLWTDWLHHGTLRVASLRARQAHRIPCVQV